MLKKNNNTNHSRDKNNYYTPELKHITVTGFANNSLNSAVTKSGAAKLKKAKVNITDEGNDLAEAMKKTVEQFKTDSVTKITDTEHKIADLKKKIATSTVEIAAGYQHKVDKLEITKTNLTSALEAYIEAGESKWEAFKHQFSKDLVEFEKEIEGFINNFGKH